MELNNIPLWKSKKTKTKNQKRFGHFLLQVALSVLLWSSSSHRIVHVNSQCREPPLICHIAPNMLAGLLELADHWCHAFEGVDRTNAWFPQTELIPASVHHFNSWADRSGSFLFQVRETHLLIPIKRIAAPRYLVTKRMCGKLFFQYL
jgi:hypothetical protein